MWAILAGALMGWSLGANDAANIFGPMVGSGAIRFWSAAILSSAFILLGAVLIGTRGFATYEAIGTQTLLSAFLTMLAAGLTVTLMTLLGLPVSSTQAVVGAIIGSGLVAGGVAFAPLGKILLSWVLTPLGGLVVAYLPYRLLARYPNALPTRLIARSGFLRIAMTLALCYSAFSLGANNVANVAGVYVGAGLLKPLTASLFGAATIGLGILTFSKRVIQTVGNRIVPLDPVSALVVVLAEAATLNVFAIIGVPVSASQAVVGAVLGIGLVKGVQTVDGCVLRRVLFGWFGTPTLAAIVSVALSLGARLLGHSGA
jgi:PiT family inorganic phosphate transporter